MPRDQTLFPAPLKPAGSGGRRSPADFDGTDSCTVASVELALLNSTSFFSR